MLQPSLGSLSNPVPIYQLERAVCNDTMLRKCAHVVLELLVRQKQLLPQHRDPRHLTNSHTDLMDRVQAGLNTDSGYSFSVRRREVNRHADLAFLGDSVIK